MSFTRVPGTKITARQIPKHTWNADLVYYEGPLISLYRSEQGEDVLYIWLDCTSIRHRWCILPVSRESLRGYLNQAYSLLELFSRSKYLITFDTGEKFRKTGITLTNFDSLPMDYRPEADSYLSEDIATPAAISLQQELTSNYFLGLNGEELYVEELSKIQRLFQQLYSFHYGLSYSFRVAVRDRLRHYSSEWSGGMSAVNLFSGLNNVIPSIHRPRVSQLAFNSPGHIKLDLLLPIAKDIELSIGALSHPDRFRLLDELYQRAYRYFKESGISGFESETNKIATSLTSETQATLESFAIEFFRYIGWDYESHELNKIESNPLLKLRMLFAYYRRLTQLRTYVVEGKLMIGSSPLEPQAAIDPLI